MPSPRHRRAGRGPPPTHTAFPQPGRAAARARVQPGNQRGNGVPVTLWVWASGRRSRSPPWGEGRTGPLGGAGPGRRPRGPQAAQRGWAAGAPAGRGRALSAAAPLWEGASPGTRWRGKGGIAGARHAERPRSACNAAGGGAGAAGAPARPWPPLRPPTGPPAGDPAPLCPRRLSRAAAASASLRRAPAAAAAENGCQSGASRHAATGGGRAPQPTRSPARSPCPRTLRPGRRDPRGHLGARAAEGASREGEGRLPAAEGDTVRGWQEDSAGRALSVCPSPSPLKPRALARSRRPGGEMLMSC